MQTSTHGSSKPCSSVPAISAGLTCGTSATARTRTVSPFPRACCFFAVTHQYQQLFLPYPTAVACQYHSCGNTPCTHSFQRQEECKYRARGNAQFYWLHSSYRRRTLPQTKGSDSMVNFGHPLSNGPGPIATADSDIMHHQFRLSLLQWNPGPARRNPSNIVSAACGRFHTVILQEASDHVPHISDYFRAYTDNMDLAILLNKDTFEPDPTVLTFKADSTSKNTWSMVLLIVRACCVVRPFLAHLQ